MRAELGPRVTIVAATKYVSLEDMAVLAEAGIEVVGENRAQDLEAKHAVYGDAFRWHFIGHLQSRKAPTVSATCELCHSLSSESAARKLTIPALVEVNLSGEPTKSGVTPDEIPMARPVLGPEEEQAVIEVLRCASAPPGGPVMLMMPPSPCTTMA